MVSELITLLSLSSGDSPGSKRIASVEPVILNILSFLSRIVDSFSAAFFIRASPI
jgi:hypothetical protein